MFEFVVKDFYTEAYMIGYPFLYAKFHGKKVTFTDKVMELDTAKTLIAEYEKFLTTVPAKV